MHTSFPALSPVLIYAINIFLEATCCLQTCNVYVVLVIVIMVTCANSSYVVIHVDYIYTMLPW